MKICPGCNQQTELQTCPTCGVLAADRIDSHFVVHELRHGILHLESGLLYTVKELLIRPGLSIRNYVNGDRWRHYKPVGFLVITSLLYLVLKHFLRFREAEAGPLPGTNTAMLMQWVGENYTYANLLEIVIIAMVLRLFFNALSYNFFEYLVVLCYLTGMGMLMAVIAMLLAATTGIIEIFSIVFLPLFFLYAAWGIGQFTGGGLASYVKAFFAYVIGMLVFTAAIFCTGLALDLLKL